jgi:hypothetical protein
MAALIYVAGPTKVEINTGAGLEVLGYSDNDNLPAIQFTDHQHEVKTVVSGAAPEEIVLQGLTARISVALVKWDQDVLDDMLVKQRSLVNKVTVGRRIVANAAYFTLKISSIANGSGYEFPYAFLQQDGLGDSQWGNRERVLTLAFNAIPNPLSQQLFTETEPA